jgi:chromosome segregation ATPase
MSRWVNAIATLIEGCADAMREAAGAHSEFEYKQIKQELLDLKAQLIEANAERDEIYDELDFARKEHEAHKAYVLKQSNELRDALEPLRNEGEAHDTKTLLGRIGNMVVERNAAVSEAARRLDELVDCDIAAETADADLRAALGEFLTKSDFETPLDAVRHLVSWLSASRANGAELERQLRAAKDDADHQRMLAKSYQDSDHAARAKVRELEAQLEAIRIRQPQVNVITTADPESQRRAAEELKEFFPQRTEVGL